MTTPDKLAKLIEGVQKEADKFGKFGNASISRKDLIAVYQCIQAQRQALEDTKKDLLDQYEKDSERRAIDAEFGVSEWESFMPKAYHTIKSALAATDRLIGEL